MDKALLVRRAVASGTFGILEIGGHQFYTLERLPHGRFPCIPAGKYECRPTFSPKFRRQMYEVMRVPGRSGIRIHAANYVHQLQGCIALGQTSNFKTHIGRSITAMAEFESLMLGAEFDLEVVWSNSLGPAQVLSGL